MYKRAIFVLAALLLIAAVTPLFSAGGAFTRANWVASVGFPVNPNPPGFKAGMTVDATNVDALGQAVPNAIKILIKKYALKMGTRNYEPIVPSNGYIDATNKYYQQVKLIDTGADARKKGISNYGGGLPFPKPDNGLKIAWNYQYSYNGDDADNDFAVYWINAKSGVERHEEWQWLYIMRGMYRTDIQPLPNIPESAAAEKQYYSMTICKTPLDKKGFTALYWRYLEPKDQEGYIYIPAQRRETRFSFGTRGDQWNNTDLLYEDVRGYMGYPEWMNWKIIEKGTYMAPLHSGIPIGKNNVEQVFDFKTPPYWNFKAKWEPRPMYVVEAIPKFKDYPYSKMICYFDAENYYIIFKEAYDKKGQLWKMVLNAYNASPDPTKLPLGIGTSLVIDLQAGHATAFPWYSSKANIGLQPNLFTLASLRKMGK